MPTLSVSILALYSIHKEIPDKKHVAVSWTTRRSRF